MTAAQEKAQENYKKICQPCHGPKGKSALPGMTLADGEWTHGDTIDQIAKTITEGVPKTVDAAEQREVHARGDSRAGEARTFVRPQTWPKRRQKNDLMPDVNVALIGYAFMGRAHSNAYRQVNHFFSPSLRPKLKVLCGRTQSKVAAAARQLGLGRGLDGLAGGRPSS